MILSDYVWQRLAAEGVDTCFLVFGGAMAELAEALTRQQAIRYVVCQHEQAACFAAEGYAKAKGVPGVVLVTSGPGGGNIMTGLQNCWFDSVPLVALCGQVATNLITPQGSKLRQTGFQEAPVARMAEPITKLSITLMDAGNAREYVDKAVTLCRSGRPGPVVLEIPTDVQRAQV